MADNEMSKEDRKQFILKFLAETGISVTPKILHKNMEDQITWELVTTRRLLNELVDDGHVAEDPDIHGGYYATETGKRHLNTTADN